MPMSERHITSINRAALAGGGPNLAALESAVTGDALHGLAREAVARLAQRARAGEASRKREAEIAKLADLLLDPSPEAATAHVNALLGRGVTVEELYTHHLADAARHLGRMWDESRLSFAEVTLGVGRIYGLLRALRAPLDFPDGASNRYALFANVPGETHTLGVSMAADLFRRQGWDIELKLGLDHDELLSEIEGSDARLIGLSACASGALPALARLILSLRVVKPDAFILVGGRLVRRAPEMLEPLAADAVTSDVATAMQKLRLLSDLSDPGA